MGTVIGYKGTPTDRTANWLTMLMTKESYKHFRNSQAEEEKKVSNLDKGVYTHFLLDYVKKAS